MRVARQRPDSPPFSGPGGDAPGRARAGSGTITSLARVVGRAGRSGVLQALFLVCRLHDGAKVVQIIPQDVRLGRQIEMGRV